MGNTQISIGEPVMSELVRIGGELLDEGIRLAANAADAPSETLHRQRKICKWLRALLRLARPSIGDAAYTHWNRAIRDASRTLAEYRDAAAMIETCQKLAAAAEGKSERRAVEKLTAVLGANQYLAEDPDVRRGAVARAEAVANIFRGAKTAWAEWNCQAAGFAALAKGLKSTYRRGRELRARAAEDCQNAELLHQWRKQAKYLRHQIEALLLVRPPAMKALHGELVELSEILGDDHDVSELLKLVESSAQFAADSPRGRGVRALAARRQEALRRAALSLGAKIYAQPPKLFIQRIEGYWEEATADKSKEVILSPNPA